MHCQNGARRVLEWQTGLGREGAFAPIDTPATVISVICAFLPYFGTIEAGFTWSGAALTAPPA